MDAAIGGEPRRNVNSGKKMEMSGMGYPIKARWSAPLGCAIGAALVATPAAAARQPASPTVIPPQTAADGPAPQQPPPAAVPAPPPAPVPPPPAPRWRLRDAMALLDVIQRIDAEGLIPADYQPEALAAAIDRGEGRALNETATRLFTWLAEDLRDGRTPMKARVQWFAVDPDQDLNPTAVILARALDSHNIPGELASLTPLHPDYLALKQALATASGADAALIRANLDRWRWLARDMGKQYLITNVPEYMLRLSVNNKIITTYRTVVGTPRTPTPQLAETVEGVIFNPTWTVPQSIVKGEGLGAQLLANPSKARRQGYKVTKASNGVITVVQQPGAGNSLGLMKLDMPNPHSIFLHDTPAKSLFNSEKRAFSHGCVRVERATELGMMMAILGAGLTKEQGVAHAVSGTYTKVPMTRTFPIYITYFTYAQDVNGQLRKFTDIYGRDAPVLASFQRPRELHTTQRTSSEPVVEIVDPLT